MLVMLAMQCWGDRDGSTHVCASSLDDFMVGVGLEISCADAWAKKTKESLAKRVKSEPMPGQPLAVTFSDTKGWPEHGLALDALREALKTSKAKPGLEFSTGATNAVQGREGAVFIWIEAETFTVGGFEKSDAIARSMARSLGSMLQSKGLACLEFEHNEEPVPGDSAAQALALAWSQSQDLARAISQVSSKAGSSALRSL